MRPDASDNTHADEPSRDTGKPAATKDPGAKPRGDTKKAAREPEVYSRTAVPAKPEKPLNATPMDTEPKDEAAAGKPATTPKPDREPEVQARSPFAEDPAVSAPALGRATVTVPGERDSLLAKESRDDLHDRWQALQLRFIDDPQSVARDAGSLVEESLEQLRAALSDRKRELDDWHAEGTADTERLRRVVCDYRELFDNVLGH